MRRVQIIYHRVLESRWCRCGRRLGAKCIGSRVSGVGKALTRYRSLVQMVEQRLLDRIWLSKKGCIRM